MAKGIGITKLVGEVVDVVRHRNGVDGEGFYSVVFRGARGSHVEGTQLVAVVFDQDPAADELCRCAVLNAVEIGTGSVDTCYRGDTFATELREAIRVWKEEAK